MWGGVGKHRRNQRAEFAAKDGVSEKWQSCDRREHRVLPTRRTPDERNDCPPISHHYPGDPDMADRGLDVGRSIRMLRAENGPRPIRPVSRVPSNQLVRSDGALQGRIRTARQVEGSVAVTRQAVTKRAHQSRSGYWEHNAPLSWAPALSPDQIEEIGCDELPGATFHRLMSDRFSIVWSAPSEARNQTFADCRGCQPASGSGGTTWSCRDSVTAP